MSQGEESKAFWCHIQCADHRSSVEFFFKQTGALFIKDGKTYHIERKYQSSQARKAKMDFIPGGMNMEFPEKLFDLKEDEDGYGYHFRDENGELVTSTYSHWYDNNKYRLIWESKEDYLDVPPAVYRSVDANGVYERVTDDHLIGMIFTSFRGYVSKQLQTDGPAWYYENLRNPGGSPALGMMSKDLGMMLMNSQPPKSASMDFSDMKTDIRFCPNCGGKREGELKFCPECGARLAK